MLELADIQQAAERVHGQVLETPCVESRTLSQLTGTQLFLKMDSCVEQEACLSELKGKLLLIIFKK